MILIGAQPDVNLIVFYVWFFTVLCLSFSLLTAIRSNLNYKKINEELSESLYECRENSDNFDELEDKLNNYEKDIEQIEERRRGRKP